MLLNPNPSEASKFLKIEFRVFYANLSVTFKHGFDIFVVPYALVELFSVLLFVVFANCVRCFQSAKSSKPFYVEFLPH